MAKSKRRKRGGPPVRATLGGLLTAFDAALAITLQYEGGASNNPNDPGGLTYKGITQQLYETCCRHYGWPMQLVTQATADQIRTIYHDQFWVPARCEAMSEPWAIAAFDFAVNSGVNAALIGIQVALKVRGLYKGKIDGNVGPLTLAAMKQNPATILLDHRGGFNHGLWVENARLTDFMNGWIARDQDLRARISAMWKEGG